MVGRVSARPRDIRLLRTADYVRVRESGKSSGGPFFRLVAMNFGNDTESKVGIVASRRVGGAVIRNRVRRRLREIHRLSRQELRPGFHVVVDVRKAAASASFDELRREWLRLAKKLSILRPS